MQGAYLLRKQKCWAKLFRIYSQRDRGATEQLWSNILEFFPVFVDQLNFQHFYTDASFTSIFLSSDSQC